RSLTTKARATSSWLKSRHTWRNWTAPGRHRYRRRSRPRRSGSRPPGPPSTATRRSGPGGRAPLRRGRERRRYRCRPGAVQLRQVCLDFSHELVARALVVSERDLVVNPKPRVQARSVVEHCVLLPVGDCDYRFATVEVLTADQLVEQAFTVLLVAAEDHASVGNEDRADVDRSCDWRTLDVVALRCADAVSDAAAPEAADRDRHALRPAFPFALASAALHQACTVELPEERLAFLQHDLGALFTLEIARQLEDVLVGVVLPLPGRRSLVLRGTLRSLG